MRGDKFAAKRSRAYRSECKNTVVDAGGVLEACVKGFSKMSYLDNDEEAVTLLVMCGLGVALEGPDRFESAVRAFNDALERGLPE